MGIPDTFTPFWNKVEKHREIGMPFDVPAVAFPLRYIEPLGMADLLLKYTCM